MIIHALYLNADCRENVIGLYETTCAFFWCFQLLGTLTRRYENLNLLIRWHPVAQLPFSLITKTSPYKSNPRFEVNVRSDRCCQANLIKKIMISNTRFTSQDGLSGHVWYFQKYICAYFVVAILDLVHDVEVIFHHPYNNFKIGKTASTKTILFWTH